MKYILLIATLIFNIFITGCAHKLVYSDIYKVDETLTHTEINQAVEKKVQITYNEIKATLRPMPIYNKVFTQNEIPVDILSIIDGNSYKENDNISLQDLRYLKMSYIDFNGNYQVGEMIVNKLIAEDILEIFEILYDNGFQIEKMNLVDHYNSDDKASMMDNNTSAFNYRVVEGTTKLSNHAYGVALDINPVQNPYIKGSIISPTNSEKYYDRTDVRKGMIVKGDVCYNAFIDKGFIWGGEWKTIKDYQHFEKELN